MEITTKDIKENLNQIDERFCEAITNTIDSIYNEILKAFLPDSIEDKVIKIKGIKDKTIIGVILLFSFSTNITSLFL